MANIAFLPAAIDGAIQQGFLTAGLQEALKPTLAWRALMSPVKHNAQGVGLRAGESATMTRDGLIQPSTDAESLLAPGAEPVTVTRSLEQWSYAIKSRSAKVNINLPGSALAQANRFLADLAALGFQARHTLNRLARNAIFAAYGGGNSFATALGSSSTSLVVADATGFDTVMTSAGLQVAVSSANPGALSINGAANVAYTAVDLTTNTITLSAAQTWSQYDSVVRSDAPKVIRANSRATDRLIVSGDTATVSAFRDAAAYLRGHNVPGIDGTLTGDYGSFIDTDIENALSADSEFRSAINGAGMSTQAASGLIGRYAGIQFFRQPKSETPIIASAAPYQTTIHKSLVFGADVCAEMFVAENDLLADGDQNAVGAQHFRTQIDEVITMVLQAPQDALGRTMKASWIANVDYACPCDSKAITGTQRHKRAVPVHTAGPA